MGNVRVRVSDNAWATVDETCPKETIEALKNMVNKINMENALEKIRKKGLYNKYIVSKADGSQTDPDAQYFVLRLDERQSDENHLRACRKAIQTYAKAIEKTLPFLAQDLRKQYPIKRKY